MFRFIRRSHNKNSRWISAYNGMKLINLSTHQNYYALRIISNNQDYVSCIDYSIGDDLCIHQINTHKNYERKGFATKLIQIAELDAKNRNVFKSKLYIHENKSKETFYTRLGYKFTYDNNGDHIRWINPYYIEMTKSLEL